MFPVIEAFAWLKYVTGSSDLSNLCRYLGFSDFHITIGFSFLPDAVTKLQWLAAVSVFSLFRTARIFDQNLFLAMLAK